MRCVGTNDGLSGELRWTWWSWVMNNKNKLFPWWLNWIAAYLDDEHYKLSHK